MNIEVTETNEKEHVVETIQFTVVNHVARKALDLSWTDYCIIDSIYHLSNNPKSKGWCTQSNEGLADFLGCNEKAVRRAKETGLEKGLLEIPPYPGGVEDYKKHRHDHRIRTTQKWYDTNVINRNKVPIQPDKMSSYPDKMSECPPIQPDKMSNNNNSVYNNRNKDTSTDVAVEVQTSKNGTITFSWPEAQKIAGEMHQTKEFVQNSITIAIKRMENLPEPRTNPKGWIIEAVKKGWGDTDEDEDRASVSRNRQDAKQTARGFEKLRQRTENTPEAQEFFKLGKQIGEPEKELARAVGE